MKEANLNYSMDPMSINIFIFFPVVISYKQISFLVHIQEKFKVGRGWWERERE
jgi:hypothetical protein